MLFGVGFFFHIVSVYVAMVFTFYCLENESESHSVMSDSATPCTLQSLEYSRPEYWSRYPFPSPRGLPNPGIEPRSLALQDFVVWSINFIMYMNIVGFQVSAVVKNLPAMQET